MADVDYRSIPPDDLLTEAHQALDATGNAVAQGVCIAPGYVMRLLITAREILGRHTPRLCGHCPDNRGHYLCAHCGAARDWPCQDVEAVFRVLAVGEEGDTRRGAAVIAEQDPDPFVAVIQDGIDFDIECGRCGYTERNVATSEDAARRVADAHEQQCTGGDNP
jgi:hypothetical protein